jgi:adhesin transport system membrane fusion protein
VIPSDRLQVVQSADGGVVKEILVKAGERVKQGQLLVRLDRVKIAAAVDESRARQAALLAQLARLNAELFDRPLEFPPELAAYPELTDNQSRLYEKRRSALQGELRTLGSLLQLASQELRMTEPLLKTGDVSRAEVLRLQRQVADLQGQISAKRNRYLQELQTDLAKVQEELNSVGQTRRQREDQLAYTDLTAPTDGIVKNIRFTTVGAVLRPGDEMLQIVPTDAPLIVEAKVKPSDIGFIRVGQSATVKFDAYDYLIYGSASGKVTFISPDTLTEQGSKGEEQVFYRVQVRVDISRMRPRTTGEVIELQPGMVAMAEIKTGQNTVLRYLLKPLVRTMDNALSER